MMFQLLLLPQDVRRRVLSNKLIIMNTTGLLRRLALLLLMTPIATALPLSDLSSAIRSHVTQEFQDGIGSWKGKV